MTKPNEKKKKKLKHQGLEDEGPKDKGSKDKELKDERPKDKEPLTGQNNVSPPIRTALAEVKELPKFMPADVRRPRPTAEELDKLRQLFSSRWQSIATLKEIEKETGISYKRGKFSLLEKQTLSEAAAKFMKERNITMEDFKKFFVDRRKISASDPRLRNFFTLMAQQLDGRSLDATYHCLWRMYHPGNNRGRWSSKDDQELKRFNGPNEEKLYATTKAFRLFAVHGPNWELIGTALGRIAIGCRDRYRAIRVTGRPGRWSDEEEMALRAAVHRVQQMKNKEGQFWTLVTEMVATRTMSQCLVKWSIMKFSDLNFGRRLIWTPHDDYLFISRIYDLGVEHETEIIWKDMAEEGYTKIFGPNSLRNRWAILRRRVRGNKDMDMDSILETLLLLLRPLVSVNHPAEELPEPQASQ